MSESARKRSRGARATESARSFVDEGALTLCAVSAEMRAGRMSPVEVTRACLERIEELNLQLNAFITVTAESAMDEARAAEREMAAGRWRGPRHGVPIALKDLIDTAGMRTTA